MKKSKRFLILGIVLFFIGVIFVVSSLPNLTWKKMISPELNFEFEYPSSWIMEFNNDKFDGITSPTIQDPSGSENENFFLGDYSLYSQDGSTTIRISVSSFIEPEKISNAMRGVYQEIYVDYTVIKEGKIIIDNHEAYQRRDTYFNRTSSGLQYTATEVTYVADRTRLYSIILIEYSESKMQNSLAVYNRVLDSFHILAP